jgi:predicted phosphodiesterase
MTLLIIADDEFATNRIPDSKADLLISCGDMPNEFILRAAAKCSCQRILAVKGNHDSSGDFPLPIEDLHLRTLNYGGLKFGGFCGSWKYKPRGNYLFEQSEVETALTSLPSVDVFVAHNSPRLVHDRDDEVHLGFVAFLNYINHARPRYFFHGHQHVHQETAIGGTSVVGTYGYRFLAIAE